MLGVWGLAAIAWFTLPADQRMPSLMGHSWRICAASIGLMALPVFAAALVALKGMAPTRPALAGAAAGRWPAASGRRSMRCTAWS